MELGFYIALFYNYRILIKFSYKGIRKVFVEKTLLVGATCFTLLYSSSNCFVCATIGGDLTKTQDYAKNSLTVDVREMTTHSYLRLSVPTIAKKIAKCQAETCVCYQETLVPAKTDYQNGKHVT